MDSVKTDARVVEPTRHTFANRFKPRLSAQAQFVLAGVVWYAAAIALGMRGLGWLVDADLGIAFGVAGVVVGLAKGRFIMSRVASRAIERIRQRDRDRCAGGFFSWQSWLIVLVMMAGGHALRLTETPRPILGALYVAIATGLLFAGRLYWAAAMGAASRKDETPAD